jgi:hypothetical protein
MKQIKTNALFVVATSVLILFSCNDTATSSESVDSDTNSVASNANTADMPPYDASMDPYNIGGEGMKKLRDTLGVKMYEFTVKPGESWKVHTHPDHTVYMLQGGKMALFMGEAGRQDTLTFPTGMALVSGPLTDSGRNIGKTTIKMLVTDIYRPRDK